MASSIGIHEHSTGFQIWTVGRFYRANSGIRLEAARQCVKLEADKLILAVRSISKGKAARTDILKSLSSSKYDVEVWMLDLESFDSVLAFGKRATDLPRLDVAILNAGVFKFDWIHMWTPFKEQKAENILEGLNKEEFFKDSMDRYSVTKLLNVFWIRQLASCVSEEEIVINFFNPGSVGSGLHRDNKMLSMYDKIIGRTLEEGSRLLMDAAVVKGVETDGKYMKFRPYSTAYLAIFTANNSGDAKAASNILNEAVKEAQDIDLFLEERWVEFSDFERERRRRAAWSIYVWDRFFCTFLGRFPLVPKNHFETLLPSETPYTIWEEQKSPTAVIDVILHIKSCQFMQMFISAPSQKAERFDPVTVSKYAQKFQTEFIDLLPPAFGLKDPDTTTEASTVLGISLLTNMRMMKDNKNLEPEILKIEPELRPQGSSSFQKGLELLELLSERSPLARRGVGILRKIKTQISVEVKDGENTAKSACQSIEQVEGPKQEDVINTTSFEGHGFLEARFDSRVTFHPL
ncbi:hypothetical protein G7Y89_g9290 [Cudoniella acicularis]|uniref:Xylanolytic transcriptional activator regulatory domain-containing protein n=1 Tax=Cudoniella acicularis TaxID=354080 RepID=A0A8H4REY7_9HELO|nr:hypothetical protein G7Y89_g9290 [Cudoniella acicularis]